MFLIHTSPKNAEIVARAVTSACRVEGWQSPVQPKLLHTLFNRLLGQDLGFENLTPTSPAEVMAALRSEAERDEAIQLMVAVAGAFRIRSHANEPRCQRAGRPQSIGPRRH